MGRQEQESKGHKVCSQTKRMWLGFWEWIMVNYVVNATINYLPGFYIFKGGRIKDDYIKLCKVSTCMAMQTKTWMTFFLFKEFLSFFKKLVHGEIFHSNQHLLILDNHGSHVMLEEIAQA